MARFTRGMCSLGKLQVWLVINIRYRIDNRTGKAVAIKIIDVENAEDEVEDIVQEIAILAELKSNYVTHYHGSYIKGSHLWIVMEYCAGGSCSDLIKPGPLNEDYISIILRELLLGLEYLHGDNKIHRDIKGMSFWFYFTCASVFYSTDRISYSCEYPPYLNRSGQACRFWSLRTAFCNIH